MPVEMHPGQTIAGQASWAKPDGSVAPSRAPYTASVSDPLMVTVRVPNSSQPILTASASVIGSVTVTLVDADGNTASDTVNVTKTPPLAGKIVWGTAV